MTKIDEKQNSGFIFGLTLGAAVGALATVLINKNSDQEIVKNFEDKVKEFFQDLINSHQSKPEKPSPKIEFIDFVEEEEVSVKKKSPKMFVKPKK